MNEPSLAAGAKITAMISKIFLPHLIVSTAGLQKAHTSYNYLNDYWRVMDYRVTAESILGKGHWNLQRIHVDSLLYVNNQVNTQSTYILKSK